MSLYLMCAYGETPLAEWFRDAWAESGKKLDMGKACVRFNRLEDLALDCIAEALRRMPARKWIEICEGARRMTAARSAKLERKEAAVKKPEANRKPAAKPLKARGKKP